MTPQGSSIQDLFLDRLPAEKSGQHYEVRTVTPSGVERTFDLIVSPLTAEGGGVIGYVYLFDDLTMLKRLEREVRLRDRLAAVGRLAAGIAHEIRNPLSSIAGSVKLLASIAALNDDQRALVDIVTRESGRLNSIIGDFLTYSREKKYQMRTVDLVLLLEDTLTLLENTPGQPVEIRRKFAADHAYTVGDADKLKQVFWNICNNALRAISARQQPGAGQRERRARPQGRQLDSELLRYRSGHLSAADGEHVRALSIEFRRRHGTGPGSRLPDSAGAPGEDSGSLPAGNRS